jgi:asparagine synthase (glutamine-hydrolysing)
MLKKKMDEATLAKHFADSVWHSEHHMFDLNSVGKFALSTLPREHDYKVVLSGEGSDEHFAGYTMFLADYLLEADDAMPDDALHNFTMRTRLASSGAFCVSGVIPHTGSTFMHGYKNCEAFSAVNNVHMPMSALAFQPTLDLWSSWVQKAFARNDIRLTAMRALDDDARDKMAKQWHPLHSSMYIWNKLLLPNMLLTCLGDRAEMAHSIEGRPPFLDHVLSE